MGKALELKKYGVKGNTELKEVKKKKTTRKKRKKRIRDEEEKSKDQ